MDAIRLMTVADLEPVAAMMARAFFDDPLQMWVVPKDDTRLETLHRVFAAETEGDDPNYWYTDTARACAAFWLDPESTFVPATSGDNVDVLAELLGDGVDRLKLAMDAMVAAHPSTPHFYLEGLGTDPPRQGEGRASAAVRPILDVCDRDGIPAYLEATKERNVPFYERRGFRVTGTIDVPAGGPRLWTMWRDPQPAPASLP
jgi:GNAT superfamily N-acetyltransferase